MGAAQIYMPPVLIMVALSYLVALVILFTRLGDLISGRRTIAYYEDWDGIGASVAVMRPTRQLVNLFEFPVLFYTASAMLIAVNMQDIWLPKLCWAFVALRSVHTASHLSFNRLWLRTPVFMASNLILISIWVRLALLVLK